MGNTVVDWLSFFQNECENYIERQPQEIGGMDAQGEPLTWEIDESNFFYRKYHKGQWRQGHWVFGRIERGTGKCFLVEVDDRSATTLQATIVEYILQGSHIMSDSWAGS